MSNLKIAIIADDLTGASDTGVQFARRGMKTCVVLKTDRGLTPDADAVIVDTDSRSLSGEEAYRKVKAAAEYVQASGIDLIYKKIDSTMRGNIGAELDAVYDVCRPDFIVFAPAYPQYNRVVRDGRLYVDGRLLHESEFACDPKTPITDSDIARMIGAQSGRKTGMITEADLSLGNEGLAAKLERYRSDGVAYLVFDSSAEEHLRRIVDLFRALPYRVAWSGSAGLANYVTAEEGGGEPVRPSVPQSPYPVLTVVGSVNLKTRLQLDQILSVPGVKGVELRSHQVVAGEAEKEAELERMHREAGAWIAENRPVVIYSSGSLEEIELAQKTGSLHGLDPVEVSDRISEALGNAASRLLMAYPVSRLILTGGDTAKQVSNGLNVHTFELIDEVETGVPVGILHGERPIYVVTKAGGFGSEHVLVQALKLLQGEERTCAQS